MTYVTRDFAVIMRMGMLALVGHTVMGWPMGSALWSGLPVEAEQGETRSACHEDPP